MYPHYDVTVSVQRRALALGAQVGDKRTIVACAKRLRTELGRDAHSGAPVGTPRRTATCGGGLPSDTPSQLSLFGT